MINRTGDRADHLNIFAIAAWTPGFRSEGFWANSTQPWMHRIIGNLMMRAVGDNESAGIAFIDSRWRGQPDNAQAFTLSFMRKTNFPFAMLGDGIHCARTVACPRLV